MSDFETKCCRKLVEWYNGYNSRQTVRALCMHDVYVVWSCKALQNYKALLSTNVDGDGIYAEYTFNGDKGELYEDVYKKLTNTCYARDEYEGC